MRKLRAGSVVSAGLSMFLMAVSGVSLAGSTSSPKETNLWIVALLAGFVLAATSILYTVTEKKWIGFMHGAMMALTALSILAYCFYVLVDLRKDPRGGFVEMAAIPVCGGFIIFAIVALGSASQTFFTVVEKRPNQPSQPMPLTRHG
jgi:hypothetical protein